MRHEVVVGSRPRQLHRHCQSWYVMYAGIFGVLLSHFYPLLQATGISEGIKYWFTEKNSVNLLFKWICISIEQHQQGRPC